MGWGDAALMNSVLNIIVLILTRVQIETIYPRPCREAAKGVRVGSTTVSAGETRVEITGLSPGAKYTFNIEAKNTVAGVSPALKVSMTTQKFVAPKAAKVIVADAKKGIVGDIQLTTVIARWQPQEHADDGYVITWFDPKNKNATLQTETVLAGATEYKITGLLPGTQYTITVEAKNTTTTERSAKLTISAKTLAFVAPKSAKVETGDLGLTSVTARWQSHDHADAGYTITWFDPKNKNVILGTETVSAGTTQYKITGLQPGTTYTYTVQAMNSKTAVRSAVLTVSATTQTFAAPKLAKAGMNDIDANSRSHSSRQGSGWRRVGAMASGKSFVISSRSHGKATQSGGRMAAYSMVRRSLGVKSSSTGPRTAERRFSWLWRRSSIISWPAISSKSRSCTPRPSARAV